MTISSVMIIDDNEGDRLLNEIAIHEYDENITIHHSYDGQEALVCLVICMSNHQ